MKLCEICSKLREKVYVCMFVSPTNAANDNFGKFIAYPCRKSLQVKEGKKWNGMKT